MIRQLADRSLRAILGLVLLGACLGIAKSKPDRQWIPGLVVEMNSERLAVQSGSTTTGQVDPYGNVSATTSSHVQRHDEDAYAIDTPDRLIVVVDSIPRGGGSLISCRLRKGAGLSPGDSVKIAVDRGAAYVLGADGKEHKLQVRRVVLKNAGQKPAVPAER